ncbi:conserved hypothetical protein, partial [Listeria ivanovii FSL F6-596]
AKALPLLFPIEVKAYKTSEKPCAPLAETEACTLGIITATAVPNKVKSGGTKISKQTIFISYGSIFLPRYSGVRPTKSPAINTVKIIKPIIP